MLKIGNIYRQAKDKSTYNQKFVDGLANYYYETHVEGFDNSFFFQRGIHPVRQITGPDNKTRCPLIIISSSPHKAGSDDTPWQDKYDPDRGYVRYYGDNKPEKSGGNNKILLDLLPIYDSREKDKRATQAVPIVFFERTTVDGRMKGNLVFQGFGLLESAELVTQYDTKKHEYFANYLFHFCVFTMKEEDEKFD